MSKQSQQQPQQQPQQPPQQQPAATVASQMARIGFPKHAVQTVDSEMSADIKERLLAAETGQGIRDILTDWNVSQMQNNRPHIHL